MAISEINRKFTLYKSVRSFFQLANEPELDGDGFIADMKLLIGVARSVHQPLPDGDDKDRIAVPVRLPVRPAMPRCRSAFCLHNI